MNLVNHDGKIDRVPCIRIGGLGGVAKHAHFYATPRPAMSRNLVMALIAALRANDVADCCGLPAGGDEIECLAGVVRPEIELLQIARSIDPDGVGCGTIVAGRSFGPKDISILAVSKLGVNTPGIGARLADRSTDSARSVAGGVRDILLLALRNTRGYEAKSDGSGRADPFPIEGKAARIGKSK